MTSSKKHAEHEPELTVNDVVDALAVHAYLTGATTSDPVAEEHARTAGNQATEVIRRCARKLLKLDEPK